MSELEFLHMLQNLHTPFLDGLMILLSALGNGGIVWIAIAALLLWKKKTRLCGMMMLGSMLLCFLVGNIALKNIICRPRPCWIDSTVQMLIDIPSDYSFPSGHTMHGFAAALTIWLYHRRAGIAGLCLAAAIAFSRMYLFVHYPTDILAGFCIGTASAMAVFALTRRILENRKG